MEFPKMESRGIIAMKGLPFTMKTEVAKLVSSWARCPYYCIDDAIGHHGDDLDTTDEKKAFDTICKMARRNLSDRPSSFSCVIIKSSLCSEFELEKLVDLGHDARYLFYPEHPVVIIECQIRRKSEWQAWAETSIYDCNPRNFGRHGPRRFPRALHKRRSWHQVKMAKIDYDDEAWERNLLKLIKPRESGKVSPLSVRRLVLDPFRNLRLSTDHLSVTNELTSEFKNALEYLLTAPADSDLINNRNPYVVEFDHLRRSLLEKQIQASSWSNRSETLCNGGGCVFKYWKQYFESEDNNYDILFCGICQEQVDPGSSAYTCYFCVLNLHKSCAIDEYGVTKELLHLDETFERTSYFSLFKENEGCSSCPEFSRECESCLYTTHLRYGPAPTIVKHESHTQHDLSIRFMKITGQQYSCKACGGNCDMKFCYGCKICDIYYHMRCVYWPNEVTHIHGRYEHRMKLMFSHDDGIEEDDNWCDHCLFDLDSEAWFYSCQECNYCVIHVYCSGARRSTVRQMEYPNLDEEPDSD